MIDPLDLAISWSEKEMQLKCLAPGQCVLEYLSSEERRPLFLVGNALKILASFPPSCIDCCMTSPPYWGQRAYSGGGIGLEDAYSKYFMSFWFHSKGAAWLLPGP